MGIQGELVLLTYFKSIDTSILYISMETGNINDRSTSLNVISVSDMQILDTLR